MFPYRDENPTEIFPLFTLLILAGNIVSWIFFQGLGFNPEAMARSVCDFGVIPGELTGLAVGSIVPMGDGMACIVDPVAEPITLLTSQFMHGGWFHILGNMLFLWVFGNNIEDSLGHFRFLVFYLLCGVLAAVAQVLIDPASPIPMVGASGAISGVMGAYLLEHPRARVWMAFPVIIYIFRFPLPAWLFLIYWIGIQLFSGLSAQAQTGGGVAFWAHIGGFFAGMLLLKLLRPKRWKRVRAHK